MTRMRQAGFTIVELMVGATVAIISILLIAGVLAGASQQKKTTASGADAQTAGAVAAYLIERDVRMAGYGINLSALLNCTIHGWRDSACFGSGGSGNFSFQLVPVIITPGTAGNATNPIPDSITLTYGNADIGFSAPRLTQDHNGNNANYKVDNRFGFHEGNLVVVSQDGVDSDSDGLDDCTLAQVTEVPGTPGNTDNIIHNSGNYKTLSGSTVPACYNKPSGLGIGYASPDARVYNLGDMPVSKIYAIDTAKSELTVRNQVTQLTADAIAENIIFLRAQYGKDTNADGSIDTFDQTLPTTAVQWKQVKAVRFAIVARSHKREGQLVSGATLQLMPAQTLPGGGTVAAESLSLTDEQRHYRYKVFNTLVPLRNMIWSPE